MRTRAMSRWYLSDRHGWPRCAVRFADAPARSTLLRLVFADRPICLVHADVGRCYAIEDGCSHEDYALSEGELDGFAVESPRHGSCFDIRTGDVLTTLAMLPVATFEVTITPDEVLIEVARVS